MLTICVAIVLNENFFLIVKGCIVWLYATIKRISEAKLRLMIVLQIIHSVYLLSFLIFYSPTTEIILKKLLNKQEIRVTAPFDQGSERTYVNQRVKNILQLSPICTERISISTFGNRECESKNLEKNSVYLKNSKENLRSKHFPLGLSVY